MKRKFQYDIRLADAIRKYGAPEVARMLGITPDAVRQMIRNDRDIYLVCIDGRWDYTELKELLRKRTDAKRRQQIKALKKKPTK